MIGGVGSRPETEDELVVAFAPLARGGRFKPRVPTSVSGLPKTFWWLWLGMLVNRTGTFIEPFFVLYLTGPREVSVSKTGLVLAIWGCGSLISQPIGGYLTDRYGRRKTLTVGLTLSASCLLLLSLARPLWLITVIVFVLGTVADLYRPAANSAVVDLVPEQDRVRAFAVQFWAINLGFSIASVSAGVLLHFGFGLLFVLDAATTFAFGALVLRQVPETRPESSEAPARLLDPFRLFRVDRLLLVATIFVLIYAVLYAQVSITLPLAMIKHAGLPKPDFGYVIAVNGILIILVQPITIGFVGRTPRQYTLPVGIAVVGIGLATVGLCTKAWQFALSVVLLTIGEIFTAGSFQSIVSSLAPAHMRGRYNGALGLAWGGSGLFAPLLGTAAYAISPAVVWVGCLTAGLIVAAGQYWLINAIDRRTVPGAVSLSRA